MQGLLRLKPLALVCVLLPLIAVTAAVNYNDCIYGLRQNNQTLSGGFDNNGNPVPMSDATAISYTLCKSACGSSQEPFSWSTFSQQFSARLLPYLALISQLPFGAKHRLDNLMSMFLTVGSPTLAGYSLVITLLNNRWITHRFQTISYPNKKYAVRVLSNLQQAPLRIVMEDSLLASLVVLPENDEWWSELASSLDYNNTWSLLAAASILWVVIAYILTVIDSLGNIDDSSPNANGQAVGSVWLWLIPIVSGWLQLSPKCDSALLRDVMDRVHQKAFVAGESEAIEASSISERRAMSIDDALIDDKLTSADEDRSPPVYNYSRVLLWCQSADEVLITYGAASRKARKHEPVDSNSGWKDGDRDMPIHPDNRKGSRSAVEAYCKMDEYVVRSRWASGVFARMIVASAAALMMQWGTTCAAIVVEWFTPTTGLGCRGASFLLYGVLSTLVWMMLVTSSILTHYALHDPKSCSARLAAHLANLLCWTGKFVAILNALWIVTACIFQFSNVFDTCFCNSSVLGRGKKAFDVILLNAQDITALTGAWVGGLVMASVCAVIFVVFINLLVDPSR